ncbi:hypothetical protein OHB41_49590 [Streptomyces sp. NBC_01571]|uniref:hypothetical protein n=1 Tax=Streptomyces sp. NBC_01571 TaxID=2975883 RepID=UPI002258952F|nr:hypothetical protein [Streptomyces sp. NBC_01571]MCX4581016.1 hypothetical protein [Streptomyces sp. NBC_01571]
MHTLLDASGLDDGVSDSVRLAVVVLAARTPSETGVVEIRARELGRWLGLSESRVRHAVVPGLRRSGVVDVETMTGEFGEDRGLTCRVLPLWEARGKAGNPLLLQKSELATLLRLMEALMAPGWAHRDGRVTPAGLLGARTGHGAATDRLAMLLLVLETAETGRVRLCGGRVEQRYGRPVVTLARLLGCSSSRAERVMARLEDAGLVERPRRQTASGLWQASRLVVPAVTAAHGVRNGGLRGRSDGPDGCVRDLAGSALPARRSLVPVTPQVNGESEVCSPDGADLAETASLHTDHPPVADESPEADGGPGVSGYADSGCCGRPERACTHEDQALDASAASSAPAAGAQGGGPLRGENHQDDPGGGVAFGHSSSRVCPPVVSDGHGQHQQKDPGALRSQVALAPVAYLWRHLRDGQRAVVLPAVEQALVVLSGIVDPAAAPQVLANRLVDRLREVGGEALVRDPMGWLLGRGLVQRPACPDRRCDDGIRLDTGEDCPSCGNVVHIRRSLRARIAAAVDADMPYAPLAERRAETDRRLREEYALDEQRAQLRRARAQREVEQRQQAVARRRALEEDAQEARRQASCADCGLPGSAGLCPGCSYRRRAEDLVQESVDLAVAVRADLSDAAAVAALTRRCECDTRELLVAACEQACGPDAEPEWIAYTTPQIAQQIRDDRRTAALRRLLRSREAVAEADSAYAACRRGQGSEAEAVRAADAAGRRAAEYLLRQSVGELHALRQRATWASPAARAGSQPVVA